MYIWHAFSGGGYEYIILGWRIADPKLNFQLPSAVMPWVYIGATVAAFIAAIYFAIRERRSVAVLGLIGFFLTLLPVLGIVPILSIYSVRFLYLPTFFLALAVVDGVRLLIERSNMGWLPRVAGVAVVAAALVFSSMTMMQDRNWESDVTLMQSMKKECVDSPVFHYCLGNGYRYRSEYMEAANEYQRAMVRYPDYLDAYINLGGSYLMLGQTHPEYYKQAIAAYQLAVDKWKGNAPLLIMLGDAYLRDGQENAARQNYSAAWTFDHSPELKQRLQTMGVPVE